MDDSVGDWSARPADVRDNNLAEAGMTNVWSRDTVRPRCKDVTPDIFASGHVA